MKLAGEVFNITITTHILSAKNIDIIEIKVDLSGRKETIKENQMEILELKRTISVTKILLNRLKTDSTQPKKSI